MDVAEAVVAVVVDREVTRRVALALTGISTTGTDLAEGSRITASLLTLACLTVSVFEPVGMERRGARADVPTTALEGFETVVSLPLPFASSAALVRLLTAFPVTSPKASRFLLFCAVASANADDRVEAAPAIVPSFEGGFERVTIRDGRAFAFSSSLSVGRVARVTLRVWI